MEAWSEVRLKVSADVEYCSALTAMWDVDSDGKQENLNHDLRKTVVIQLNIEYIQPFSWASLLEI